MAKTVCFQIARRLTSRQHKQYATTHDAPEKAIRCNVNRIVEKASTANVRPKDLSKLSELHHMKDIERVINAASSAIETLRRLDVDGLCYEKLSLVTRKELVSSLVRRIESCLWFS